MQEGNLHPQLRTARHRIRNEYFETHVAAVKSYRQSDRIGTGTTIRGTSQFLRQMAAAPVRKGLAAFGLAKPSNLAGKPANALISVCVRFRKETATYLGNRTTGALDLTLLGLSAQVFQRLRAVGKKHAPLQ